MENIRIVEYDHSYAAKVAEMWNLSTSNWGGSNMVRTGESVQREHEGSFNLCVFLALFKEDVVGYCSFSKFANDEDSLYIPLLNVRPDFHGLKVGKALVTSAVERTIKMGWPRLDLYTWPGNTKAVPLYKKCGFFWEKRDDSTHLMNFIPYVLGTEAVAGYFETADWYGDSRRVIEVKPDGNEENGFCYFEYIWEKDGRMLRVEFEKAARGLRLIETENYLVRARVDHHELIFGREYDIHYDLVNKSGKPLHIGIKGLNHKNIRFAAQIETVVADTAILSGKFFVGEIEEECNSSRTHPSVITEITINGKKAVFKTGVMPKFPAQISIGRTNEICSPNNTYDAYINIENNFREDASFKLQLPGNGAIAFDRQTFDVRLSKGEKTVIPLKYVLSDYCCYDGNITALVTLNNGEIIPFSRKVSMMFTGIEGCFSGENNSTWHISNGNHAAYLNKQNNVLGVSTHIKEDFNTYFHPPKLGKAYSMEFFSKKPRCVETYPEGDAMVMKAIYVSGDFPGIEVASIIRLLPGGLVKFHFEVGNNGESIPGEDLFLGQEVAHNLYRGVIPFRGSFIDLKDTYEIGYDLWDSDSLHENWLFSRGENLTRGLCWPKEYRMQLNRHIILFEHSLGKLEPGCIFRTEPVCVAYGTFNRWQDFRAFATGNDGQLENKEGKHGIILKNSLETRTNKGNPFVGREFAVEIEEYKNEFLNGSVEITSSSSSFDAIVCKYAPQEQKKQDSLQVCLTDTALLKDGIFNLKIGLDFDAYAIERQQTLFVKGNHRVIVSIEEGDLSHDGNKRFDWPVYKADNGILSIKTAPDFSHCLYSLTYNGQEWLDTSFPTAGPRSWFNPWYGGIGCKPAGMSPVSIQQEKKTAATAQLRDQSGNEWSGLVVSTEVKENKQFKGLKYHQYFLLLPGVPVLCQVVKIEQDTGWFFNQVGFGTEAYFLPDRDILNNWFVSVSREGIIKKYKSGRVGYNLRSDSSLAFGSLKGREMLQVIAGSDSTLMAFVNRNDNAAFVTSKVTAGLAEKVFTQPVFYLLTQERIDDIMIKDLKNIRFE